MIKGLWKDVLRVTAVIAAITAAFVIVMMFTPYGSYKIITGAALGVAGAALSFTFLGLSVSKAVEREKKSATIYVQGTYTLRMVFMAIVIIIGLKMPYFNGYATIIPFVLIQPAVMITNAIFYKKKVQATEIPSNTVAEKTEE